MAYPYWTHSARSVGDGVATDGGIHPYAYYNLGTHQSPLPHCPPPPPPIIMPSRYPTTISARIDMPQSLRAIHGLTDTRNSFHGSGKHQCVQHQVDEAGGRWEREEE